MLPKRFGIVCGAEQLLEREHILFHACTLLRLRKHWIKVDHIDAPYSSERINIRLDEILIHKAQSLTGCDDRFLLRGNSSRKAVLKKRKHKRVSLKKLHAATLTGEEVGVFAKPSCRIQHTRP